METQCSPASVNNLEANVVHLRRQLEQCKRQVLELNRLQNEFRSKLGLILRKMEDKENAQKGPCVILTDSQTQTCEILHRRWNSDLSLDTDGKSNGKRYHKVDRSDFCVSNDTLLAPPIIRQPKKTKQKFKIETKSQVDHLLLSDLGLTSQAPEFSQSEFNLSSDEHWKTGRVRFLSQDDATGLNEEEEPLKEAPQVFHSGSFSTLTQSERDVSDSSLSLNFNEESKLLSSTPKAFRSKFKQSVSFHDLLPSKATQSMPNLPKQENKSLPLNNRSENTSKRHSFMERSSSLTRRSSIGELENGPYVPSAISSLFLGGKVKALHGGHLVVTGTVWYRGRLPGINEDIIGIELDQVGLGGDGTYQGHRYFRCSPGRGLFVPFRKVIMAWPAVNQPN